MLLSFSKQHERGKIDEWKDFYLDYDGMKEILNNKSITEFLFALNCEINKLNTSYAIMTNSGILKTKHLYDILSEICEGRSLENLRKLIEESEIEIKEHSELLVSLKSSIFTTWLNEESKNCNLTFDNINESLFSTTRRSARMMPIIRNFSVSKRRKVVYLVVDDLCKVSQFRKSNITAIIKLCESSQCYAHKEKVETFLRNIVNESFIYKNNTCDKLIDELTKVCLITLGMEDVGNLVNQLQKKPLKIDYSNILCGLLVGINLAEFFRGIEKYTNCTKSYAAFLSAGTVFYGGMFFNVCLDIFNKHKINSTLIFKFDKTSFWSPTKIISIFSLFHIFYLILKSTFIYNYENIEEYSPIQRYIEPIYFFLILLLCLIPVDIFSLASRAYFPGVYLRALLIPFTKVTFRHFYFLDVAQSYKFFFKSILALFITEKSCKAVKALPMLSCLIFPFNRILQCITRYKTSKAVFPHLANILKYSISISNDLLIYAFIDKSSVNLCLFIFLISFSVISTIYSTYWDIFLDFKIKRKNFIFDRFVYLAIISFDVCIRISSPATVIFHRYIYSLEPLQKINLGFILAMLEVNRRFLWTLLRVEVEHLNNSDMFKISTDAFNDKFNGEYFYESNLYAFDDELKDIKCSAGVNDVNIADSFSVDENDVV